MLRGFKAVGVTALTVLLLSACLPFNLGGQSPPAPTVIAEYVPGETVTSPDGSITITLPEGWNDLSTEYFDQTPDSVLSAFWSTGDDLDLPMTPFATVSKHFVGLSGETAAEIAQTEAEDWIEDLDGEIVAEDTFTTDAGGDGAWVQVVGTSRGLDKSIHVIAVVDGDQAAQIFLETYPVGGNLGTDLVEAARTIELNASVAPLDRNADGSPVDNEGRWFAYEETFSIEAQPLWTYVPSTFDEIGGTPADPTDFLGVWFPDGNASTATYSVMWMNLHSTAFDEAIVDPTVPAVGEEVTDESGRVVRTTAEGEEVTADGRRIYWRDLEAEAVPGTVAIQRLYYVELGPTATLTVFASTFGEHQEEVLAEVRAAIETARSEND